MQVSKSKFRKKIHGDVSTTPESMGESLERIAMFDKGEWHYIGVQAIINIGVPYANGEVLITVPSPGVYGIPSDSSDQFKDDMFALECLILAELLTTMGMEVVD